MKIYVKTPARATIRCTRRNGKYDVWSHLQTLQECQYIERTIHVLRDELEDAGMWQLCDFYVSIDGEWVSLDDCDCWE